MKEFDTSLLKKLYIPSPSSHKGQNGKLLIIGGSHLFHAASLWALQISSRIVDMVFYSSVTENNEIVQKAKSEFRNGIVVPRENLEDYIKEADAVLIGPGMLRAEYKIDNGPDDSFHSGSRSNREELTMGNLDAIASISDEGVQTYYLTKYLLGKYPKKKWVIDAGALQMMDLTWLQSLRGNVIVTPHVAEFVRVFGKDPTPENVQGLSRDLGIVILLKSMEDIICSPDTCFKIEGGNAGMTKGGTGDVLAGLVASLYTKNDALLSAVAGSYINKKAGESLDKTMGLYFNASDLALEIPKVMKELLL